MSANIEPEAARCLRICAPRYGELGDVERCVHGRIWYCEGRDMYRWVSWLRLSPIWQPRLYRRSQAALAASTTKGDPTDGTH